MTMTVIFIPADATKFEIGVAETPAIFSETESADQWRIVLTSIVVTTQRRIAGRPHCKWAR